MRTIKFLYFNDDLAGREMIPVPLEKKLILAGIFFLAVNIAIIVLSSSVIKKFYSLTKAGEVPYHLLLLGFGAGVAIALAFFGVAKATMKRRRD
jgi:hypothetical protein